MNFTPKELIFVNEYLANGYNGTKAAIKAGYAVPSANRTASRMLNKPKIKAYLDAQKNKILNSIELTQEKVMREIARLALSDIRKYFDANGKLKNIADLDDDAAAALASVDTDELFEGVGKDRGHIGYTKKIRTYDKTKALEMLAKHFKIYDDGEGKMKLNITIKKKRKAK